MTSSPSAPGAPSILDGRRVSFVSHLRRANIPQAVLNVLNLKPLPVVDAVPDNVARNRSRGSSIRRCCKSLLPKGLCGWEAGIRTPITWSRER